MYRENNEVSVFHLKFSERGDKSKWHYICGTRKYCNSFYRSLGRASFFCMRFFSLNYELKIRKFLSRFSKVPFGHTEYTGQGFGTSALLAEVSDVGCSNTVLFVLELTNL